MIIFIALNLSKTHDEAEKHVQSNSFDNCVHHYNVGILNLFDPDLPLINNKPVIKNKLKPLSKLKKLDDICLP